jgi:hypothetical protein
VIAVVHSGFDEVEIVFGSRSGLPGEPPLRFDSERDALDYLSRLSHGRGGMATLRRVLAHESATLDVSALDEHEVLDQLAWLVVAGRVLLVPRKRRLVGMRDEEATPAAPEAPARTRRAWIAIRLVDDDGRPVPNEPYRIVLPDGSTTEGTLDARGYARVDDIDPGTAQVSFPNRDAADWRARSSSPT